MVTTPAKTQVRRSDSIRSAGTTVADIKAAQSKVGAPDTAAFSSNATGYQPVAEGEEALPYEFTFSWTLEV